MKAIRVHNLLFVPYGNEVIVAKVVGKVDTDDETEIFNKLNVSLLQEHGVAHTDDLVEYLAEKAKEIAELVKEWRK